MIKLERSEVMNFHNAVRGARNPLNSWDRYDSYYDDEGNFVWPGFGDNMRVLAWILDRCEGKVGATMSPIGYLPLPEDINVEGLTGIDTETVRNLLSVDVDSWLDDVKNIRDFYAQIGDSVPATMHAELDALEARLLAAK